MIRQIRNLLRPNRQWPARLGTLPVCVSILLILVLALFLRVAPISSESLEGDELFSRRMATAEPEAAWRLIQQDLVHPPLYYYLLRAAIPPGDASTAWDLRWPSLAGAVLTLLALALIAFADAELRVPALLAALLLALSKLHIFYSQQARSYSVYTAMVAILLLWRVLANRYRHQLSYWVIGMVLMTAITWTHYVGAFFCAACVLPMAFESYRSRAGRTAILGPLASLAVAALLFLPWLIPEIAVVRQKAGLDENLAWQGVPTLYDLKAIFAGYVGIPLFPGATTVGVLIVAFLAGCAFLPNAATREAVQPPPGTAGMRLTLAIMAFAPTLVLWVLARDPVRLPIFGERHLLPAIVPALLLICCGLVRVALLARSTPVFGLLLGAGAAALCVFQFAPVYRAWPGPVRQPYESIANDLTAQKNLQLPVFTTWQYGIGEPVKFYLSDKTRGIVELTKPEHIVAVPARAVLLYRPSSPREVTVTKQLLQRYDIVSDRYYSGHESPDGTRLLVIQRRDAAPTN